MEVRKVDKIQVIWRGQQLNVEIDPSCNIKEFGNMLQELTNVKPDTLKLLVPTNKSSKLITPFSHDHSSLTLQDTGIIEGKVIRMMGVFEDEIEEVSDNGKRPDLRIIGFEEEEKRLRQRSFANKPQTSLILPKGSYIFCDFRTLNLPGIQLNPPPSEALKRMHKLACDPGIIAIMNKHKWRVGIMTELAPVGYVGISPQCILGFNKNMGEEISLRLRTDDLKGFRKYESIKKTLLHELAHMVHSEHNSHFFALNKQLNDEATSLDWTRSTGHTLTSRKNISSYDEDEEEDLSYEPNNIKISNKVGGVINAFASPRASSISAAYKRLINTSTNHEKFEPDPDETNTHNLHNNLDKVLTVNEPDPDETSNINNKNIEEIVMAEPDPDESVTDITNEDEMLRSDPEIERVEEAGVAICSRIQKTVRMLRSQVTPEEASSVLQTLFKIIKNVIEHPNETKFRRLRKANPHFQRNVANYANAMEVLKMVGFMEDVVADEVGRVETYVVLKRNDPGLLWLAKSSLEVSMS